MVWLRNTSPEPPPTPYPASLIVRTGSPRVERSTSPEAEQQHSGKHLLDVAAFGFWSVDQ
jgi:hypothetical protein